MERKLPHRNWKEMKISLRIIFLLLITNSVFAQCPQPQYVENGGYAAGTQVQNGGNKYECKPWPNSGWCNGAAWAYAPGTGAYWSDAWVLVEPCNAANNAPSVSISSPSSGSSFTSPATISITANASDTDGSISKVEFYNGSTKIGEDVSTPYTFSWTNVAAGSYTITAKASDNAGASTTSGAVAITVNAPVNYVATVYKHCNYDASGYAIGLEAGDYTTAQLTAKGISNNDISSLKVNSGYEIALYDADNFQGTPIVLKGDVSCLVANSFNDLASSVKVRVVTVNQLPSISIISPANNSIAVAPATVTITANASDADGSISKVEFYNGSTKLSEILNSPYSYTWTGIAAGTYSLTAVATDNVGGKTTSSVVTITVTAPPVLRDITNHGGNISAQYSDSPGNEGVDMLIDNQSSTKFLTFHNASWVQLQQLNASVVTKYTITSANDAADRDPLNWTLKGSNDGNNWVTLDSRSNEDFPNRLQKKEYTFSNSSSYTYYRLEMTNNSGTILQVAELEIWGTGGGGDVPIIPPATWTEHWFDHVQVLKRVYYDDEVAIYFDNDVNPSLTWMNSYMRDAWVYTKQVYGNFGKENRLYAIFHTNKYGGGHPSTYFDASHDYRNVTDCGPGPWTTGTNNDIDMNTHEIGHIVEGACKGVKGSPSFPIWKDSKWMEIYQYDVYKGLGRTADMNRWYNMMMNGTDDFPRANTHWFKDWFYPIYNNYGGAQVLNRYFTLLSQCFVKNGNSYARDLNWGEFIHFWSGAAGVNLKPLATTAFGWPAEYEAQFRQAQINFPCVTYSNMSAKMSATNEEDMDAVTIGYNIDYKQISVTDLNSTEEVSGIVEVYSMSGTKVLTSDIQLVNGVGMIEANGLTDGMYAVSITANGKLYRETIVVLNK